MFRRVRLGSMTELFMARIIFISPHLDALAGEEDGPADYAIT